MDWPTFLSQVENPSPGATVVDTAIKWFQDKLGAQTPALAEGSTEAMVESSLPSDIVVQACCKRLLRAVQALAAARLAQTTGPSPASSQQSTSAQQLTPTKVADVSALLDKADLKGLSFAYKLNSLFRAVCRRMLSSVRRPVRLRSCLWT